ncbi:MAG: bifunctional metallophosphatase/5'-nucleotidase [Lachnospiraceae bacterium]|nr:bifunctional metallophosphatase/5'-nucleotidase [Lachnospiraceae bacterium]
MKKSFVGLIVLILVFITGCQEMAEINVNFPDGSSQKYVLTEADTGNNIKGGGSENKEIEKNGEIMILFTSDVHCGVEEGFGYAGLYRIRDSLEKKGYTTILADNGDSIQGDTIGTVTRGEAIIDIMNELKYDVAIPGNHEFDYGMDRFLQLTGKADFPYICCNFRKEGRNVFPAYVIKEACGLKIAFVGVLTPETIITSTPAYFQNEEGEYIYDFLGDETGETLCKAVQEAVDDAKAEGADLVYVLGHMGKNSALGPWTYKDIISNTEGIDVFIDGHSHDTDKVIVDNKKGETVDRVAVGTKLNCIGYSHITRDGIIEKTDAWSWPNKDNAAELFDIDNEISEKIDHITENTDLELDKVVARTEVDLRIYDPDKKDDSGNPVRIVRKSETNLGDLCADAIKDQMNADIAIINGGGIRADIEKGDITYGDILKVMPYNNKICVIEATGEQILDALEWGSRSLPEEMGGFLQVSGITYEVDTSLPSGCISDDNGLCSGIEGDRRVKNVFVGDTLIDPAKTYSVAGINYILTDNGDGFAAFEEAKIINNSGKLDNQVIIDYITETLNGVIGGEYSDIYGQGRIRVTE